MKVLITSGGTDVMIDRVRRIKNMSSGTFGNKIATEFLETGHEVVFMKAKGSKSPMQFSVDLFNNSAEKDIKHAIDNLADKVGFFTKYQELYSEYEYTTYDQYAEMLKFVIGVEQPDIILLAAAVSDYGVENYFDGKMRSNDLFNIKLKQLPKLINRVKEWAKPSAKLVGFKMLVDSKPRDLIAAAKRSVEENQAEMVIANDLEDIKANNHKISLVFKDKVIDYKTDPTDPNYLAKMVVKHSLEL